MALVHKKDLDNGWLALWKIDESVEQLGVLAGGEYAQQAAAFGSRKRQKEWLAWRALLRQIIPNARPVYNDIGAPVIDEGFISVSHTDEYVAVLFNDRRCAIDMESSERNFSRVSGKYISFEERGLADIVHPLFEAVVWCAKETLYKLAGRKALDFNSDIFITYSDIENSSVVGSVAGENGIRLTVFTYEGVVIVYSV